MRRRARLDSAVLEQLLEGDLADGSALANVLATARAAGTAEELAGLEAARSAFESARTQPAARPSVQKLPAVTRTTAGRLLALKAIATISTVSLIGGVTYAASTTGLIEMPWHHSPASQHGSSTPTSGAGTDAGAPQPPGRAVTVAPRHTGQPHPSRATPTPNRGRGRGASVTASARASHSPVVPPRSAPATTPSARPTSTPTPTDTPTGHAKTTPPARTSAPSHSPHPAPTKP